MVILKIKRVLITLLLFSLSLAVSGSVEPEAKEVYSKGKDQVLNRRWSKAVTIFTEFKSRYKSSKLADAGIYWLIYSRFKLSGKQVGNSSTETLDMALSEQNLLEKKFGDSKWLDDSRVLKVKIGVRFLDIGEKRGERLLTEILIDSDEALRDSVILALDAMINIKGEKIFDYLLSIKKPFLAQEAVYSFSRSRSDLLPFEEKPDFLRHPEDLTYPSLALNSWISWTSVMEIGVDKTGKVIKVKTICGAVHKKLDSEVEQELMKCRYAPVKNIDGDSVEASFIEIWRYHFIDKGRKWRILRWADQSRGGIADYDG